MPVNLQLQFLGSLSFFLACLLTVYNSKDVLQNELLKVLCLIALVNMFRILSFNRNKINDKHDEDHKTDGRTIQPGGSQRDAA